MMESGQGHKESSQGIAVNMSHVMKTAAGKKAPGRKESSGKLTQLLVACLRLFFF